MHILPLILATWSYKQRVDHDVQQEQPRLSDASLAEDSQGRMSFQVDDRSIALRRSKSNALSTAERNSVRYDRVADPIDYTKQETNEVKGSHFMTTQLCHVGTDAWGSLKNRLAENGIRINDEEVAIMAAGFHAERKLQEILGQTDKQVLKDELEGDLFDTDGRQCFDAGWIRKINAHPDAKAIALECFEDLRKHYPAALGVDMREAQGAIGFDPNVIEVGQ